MAGVADDPGRQAVEIDPQRFCAPRAVDLDEHVPAVAGDVIGSVHVATIARTRAT
jgi:hypothetical protein